VDAHEGRGHGGEPGRAAPPVPSTIAGLRERAGAAVLRVATDLARERRAVVRRLTEVPAGTPGRDLALGNLAIGGWVESVLLWLGWRLLPGDAITGRAAQPWP
jgi:hypothetical protein